MSLVSVQLRIKYRNTNGDFDFDGAEYRFVDSKKTQVLASGKTNAKGLTKALKLPENTIIYVQLKNAYTGEWESPDPYQHVYLEAKKSIPIYHTTVLNCYFQAKLVGNNYITFNPPWRYRVIFKGEQGKFIKLSGTLDKNGLTPMFDAQKIIVQETNMQQQAQDRLNELARSKHPMVEVIFIEPKTGKEIKEYARVIPVGSDKKYREFKIKLTQAQTQHYTQQSMTKLEKLKQFRPITLDIKLQGGTTYTVEREDKGKLFSHELEETNKVSFKDGIPLTVYIPLGYRSKVFVKKGDKIIGTFPIAALDPNKKNDEILFTLGKNIEGQKEKIHHLTDGESTLIILETEANLSVGYYDKNMLDKLSTVDYRKLMNTFYSTLLFDGVILPISTVVLDAIQKDNRQFLYDTVLSPLFKKGDKVRFYIKKSKTGKNLIIFKGYSGLRKYLNFTRISSGNSKVGMLTTAVDIASSQNKKAMVKTGVKSTAKATGIGFILVAGFDIAEWLTTDEPFDNWSDLFVTLGIDLVKTGISTAASVVVGTAVAIAAGATTVAAAPVALVVGAGISVGLLVSFGLEWADKKFKVSDCIAKKVDGEQCD